MVVNITGFQLKKVFIYQLIKVDKKLASLARQIVSEEFFYKMPCGKSKI